MSEQRVLNAIIVCDPRGNVVHVNDQALRLYGNAAVGCIGHEWTQLLSQPVDRDVLGSARRSLEEQGEWKGTLVWKSGRGTDVKTRCSWTLVRGLQNDPLASLIVSEEIPDDQRDDRRRATRRRRETLGALSIGIAHQLNDIFASLLLVLDKQKKSSRRALSQSRSQGTPAGQYLRRGADLVSQILHFAGQEEQPAGRVQPDVLLTTLQGFLREVIPGSVEIRGHAEPGLPPVRGNGMQLYQLLVDLVIHLIDTVPGMFSLNLFAGKVSVDRQFSLMAGMERGVYVGFTISPRSDARVSDITGADLVDVKSADGLTGLAEEAARHHGVLKVKNGNGKDPEFVLLMPSESRRNGESEPEESRKEVGNGEVILVVDDEPAIRESTKMTLRTAGYTVLTAGDGAEAAALYAREHSRIAAVLIDIMMPHMTGDAAIRTMTQINPNVRVVATSGYASKEKLSHILEMDQVLMLQKPFSAAVLLSAVHRVLESASQTFSGDPQRVAGS